MNITSEQLLEEQFSQNKLSIFNKCKDKLKKISKDLGEQKERINLDDNLLGDNTFFKFLNDLLNSSKLKQQGSITDELKENEKLSKEKFLRLLTNELELNQNFSKEQKEKLGKNLSNNYVQDLAFNLVSNKLNKQNGQEQKEENKLEINAKDVVEVGIDIAQNPTPVGVAKAVGKKVIEKVIHKMTK